MMGISDIGGGRLCSFAVSKVRIPSSIPLLNAGFTHGNAILGFLLGKLAKDRFEIRGRSSPHGI